MICLEDHIRLRENYPTAMASARLVSVLATIHFKLPSITSRLSSRISRVGHSTRKATLWIANTVTGLTQKSESLEKWLMLCRQGEVFSVSSSCRHAVNHPLFDQLFCSHFFQTYGRGAESIRACSWLGHLPRLMATTFTSTALKFSTRAACMAFYGSLNGEVSIYNEAGRRTPKRSSASV